MLDLKLDSAEWDLYFEEGNLVLVSDADQTVQHIKQRLLTFYQEWFLDQSIGVPWLQQTLEKPASLSMVEVILQEVIRKSPEVRKLTSFVVRAGDSERTAKVTFTVQIDSGVSTATVELEI